MKCLKFFLMASLILPNICHAYQSRQKFTIDAALFSDTQAEIFYNINKQKFDMTSSINTHGVWQKIFDFRAQYQTDGLIKKGIPITLNYMYKSDGSSGPREKVLQMDSTGRPVLRTGTRNGKTKEVKIEQPDFKFDAPDLQSVFIQLINQFKQKSFCDMQSEVFDGKKRYQIIFHDIGQTTLDDAKISLSGKVWKCHMQIKSLDEQEEDLLWKLTARNPIQFWIVQDKKTKIPYIAKIQIDSTPLGTIKAYTEELILSDK